MMTIFDLPLFDAFDFAFFRRAMVMSALIGLTGGLLSAFVVVRRSALMVEALSHSLLPGIVIAVLFAGLNPLAATIGGATSALAVSLGAQFLAERTRLAREGAFGLLFVTSFAMGVILLSYAPPQKSVDEYLFGNLMGMSDSDIRYAFLICSLAIGTMIVIRRELTIALFDAVSAKTLNVAAERVNAILTGIIVLVLIAAVQAAGVLLAVGFLILPAMTVLPFAGSLRTLVLGAGILGALLPPASLLLAHGLDMPPGPAIIAVLGLSALGVHAFQILVSAKR